MFDFRAVWHDTTRKLSLWLGRAHVLDDPVESVLWLARQMGQYGQQIEAGQVILSGSFIRPVEGPSEAAIDADFGDFGSVAVRFDQAT